VRCDESCLPAWPRRGVAKREPNPCDFAITRGGLRSLADGGLPRISTASFAAILPSGVNSLVYDVNPTW
jgi:hypothetical protein